MPSIKHFIILTLLSLLTACVVPSDENQPVAGSGLQRLPTDAEVEQYNASVDPDDRIVCHREIPVGSNIPKRVCRLVKDVQETSEFHREQLRRVLN